jgi:hypothetical protein
VGYHHIVIGKRKGRQREPARFDLATNQTRGRTIFGTICELVNRPFSGRTLGLSLALGEVHGCLCLSKAEGYPMIALNVVSRSR